MPSPTSTVPIVPHLIPNNLNFSEPPQIVIPNVPLNSQPMPTSPTGPPPPFPPPPSVIVPQPSVSQQTPTATTTSTTQPSVNISTQRSIPNNNNDLNDAQNISKILQSLHNGSGNSTISTANHNNNININNDKNHEQSLLSSTSNHKEDKLSNEKPNRTKRKQQHASPPNQKAAATSNVTKKNSSQQHAHTNGLIVDKKSNNRLANGGDESGNSTIDDEQLEKIKEDNLEARIHVFREIRKLGRDYSGLYEELAKVKGPPEVRFNFIKMCIDEASRFRRKHMADCIQEWWMSKCDINATTNAAVVEQKMSKKKKST